MKDQTTPRRADTVRWGEEEIFVRKRKLSACVLLSVVTFGLYRIYWQFLLMKNVRAVTGTEGSVVKEMLCWLFVPFYSLYWWFTRGARVRAAFEEKGAACAGNETAYLLLGLFGVELVSMALLQNDFDSLPSLVAAPPRKRNKKLLFITQSAVIAALYAVLTLAMWQFSSLQIQVRLSEALCVLPLFTGAAVPGLYIGCVIANLLAGNVIDAVFGALATLLAALTTYRIGRKTKGAVRLILAPLPAVVFNVIAVPLVLYYGYGFTTFAFGASVISGFWPVLALSALSVLIGQVIACYGVGIPLYLALNKTGLFRKNEAKT